MVALIVAFLAKDALLKYLGPSQTAKQAGPKTPPDPAAGDAADATPGNAMDRAKGLQDVLQKESEKRGADQ